MRDSRRAQGDGRNPLLTGRGLIESTAFCRSTGIEPEAVEHLVREGRLEGVLSSDGRLVGVFEDALPTLEELGGLGFAVDRGYDPDQLRETVHDDARVDGDEADGRSTWTMSSDDRTC